MKTKLIEQATLHAPRMIQEAEGAEASKEKWTASVWRLDEINLNGRIYPTELAQRIVKENRTTTANDGHWADGAAEYACARAVCGNPRIEHGELVVDIDFIDEEYEKKIDLLHSKGVSIGVSSVGWGEMDEVGRIVPETYELVRYLDFVTTPAGDVYANKHEEVKKEENEHIKEDASLETSESSELSEEDHKLALNLSNIILRRH